jgi:hypothetical protein
VSNDDERDFDEEAFNRDLLESGDGEETPEEADRRMADAQADAEMVDYPTKTGTLLELTALLDEAWPQGLPPEMINVRVEVDGKLVEIERLELRASPADEYETIVIVGKKET